jgi:hypothetical protein
MKLPQLPSLRITSYIHNKHEKPSCAKTIRSPLRVRIPKFRFLLNLRFGLQPDAIACVSQSVKGSHTIKQFPRIAYHTKLTVMELR